MAQDDARDEAGGLFHHLTQIGREVPQVDVFAVATFAPVPLLLLGAGFGGWWPWLALIWITVVIYTLDRIIARAAPDAPEDVEFPAADRLSVALAVAHFWLMLVAVAAVSGATGVSWPARIALFFGFGLFFGQVSNSNAHELIHRGDKFLFLLGKWVYISMLFGHHTSSHRLIHHRFVGTPEDPNTAVLGEDFYSFFRRAWIGSFQAGWQAEAIRSKARKARRTGQTDLKTRIATLNPYFSYVAGGLGCIALIAVLFGWKGIIAYLLLCLYAQMQILLADYVQHYGLTRRATGPMSYEPVTSRHSWDAREPVSSLWMLNAPRHSDHHAHPGRPYPALRLTDETVPRDDRPMLPRSLPAMATLALFPTFWHRVMDRRVKRLRRDSAA